MSPAARRFFGCFLPVVFLLGGCCTCAMALYSSQIFFARVTVDDTGLVPDLPPGTVVWVDNTAYWSRSPTPGDVVWVDAPDGRVLRRVVATPGDTVAVAGGVARVNGRQVDTGTQGAGPDYGPTRVPDETFFVLADNRGAADSRTWGPVPRAGVYGIARFYDSPRSQGLRTVSHRFHGGEQ